MRSNRVIALASALAILGTACGKFGEKIDPSKILKYGADKMGCLNDFGPQMEKYTVGEVDPAEWAKTWDCALDSVKMFTDFVSGSAPDGYTQADVDNLVKTFLVTSKPIPPELVSASFKLKASMFGGGTATLTREQLDRFVEVLRVGKAVSIRLIPHLYARIHTPDGPHLLAFSEEVSKGLKEIGEALGKVPGPKGALTAEDLKTLIRALADTFGWNLKPEWVDVLMAGKELVLAGGADQLAGIQWPIAMELAGHLGGAAAAGMSADKDYFVGPNEMGEFVVGLARGARPVFENALLYHGGRVPLTVIDHLVDVLPADWLKINRTVLKESLRPAFQKLFWSQDRESIGPETVDLIYKKLDEWRAGQTHLETIFRDYKLDIAGVNPRMFLQAAKQYLTTIPEAELPSVQRLIRLATDYRPLFVGEDMQITFDLQSTTSLGNLSKMHWLNLAAAHLVKSYSTHPTGQFVQRQDMTAFISDFGWLALELAVLDPAVKDIDLKRFFEADNFVYGSNGDGLVSEVEATNYGAFLFSIGNLSKRILDNVESICQNGTGLDRYKHPWMDPDCFRKEYFGQYFRYWERFPQMVAFYEKLSTTDREAVNRKIETAARRYGYSQQSIGKYDVDSIAGVIHYIDAVFFRFDTSNNNRLDIDEVLAGYPNFRKLFAEYAKLPESQDFLLKSAFTYLIKYGEPPDQKSAAGLAKFVAWMGAGVLHLWRIDANRMSIFNVFSSLAQSAASTSSVNAMGDAMVEPPPGPLQASK